MRKADVLGIFIIAVLFWASISQLRKNRLIRKARFNEAIKALRKTDGKGS